MKGLLSSFILFASVFALKAQAQLLEFSYDSTAYNVLKSQKTSNATGFDVDSDSIREISNKYLKITDCTSDYFHTDGELPNTFSFLSANALKDLGLATEHSGLGHVFPTTENTVSVRNLHCYDSAGMVTLNSPYTYNGASTFTFQELFAPELPNAEIDYEGGEFAMIEGRLYALVKVSYYRTDNTHGYESKLFEVSFKKEHVKIQDLSSLLSTVMNLNDPNQPNAATADTVLEMKAILGDLYIQLGAIKTYNIYKGMAPSELIQLNPDEMTVQKMTFGKRIGDFSLIGDRWLISTGSMSDLDPFPSKTSHTMLDLKTFTEFTRALPVTTDVDCGLPEVAPPEIGGTNDFIASTFKQVGSELVTFYTYPVICQKADYSIEVHVKAKANLLTPAADGTYTVKSLYDQTVATKTFSPITQDLTGDAFITTKLFSYETAKGHEFIVYYQGRGETRGEGVDLYSGDSQFVFDATQKTVEPK